VREEAGKKIYGYGKRPLWQWIVIYLIFAVIIYGGIYYFFLAKKGGYTNTNQSLQTVHTTTQSNAAPTDNIYMMKTNPSKGTYLTDFQGMTLYIFNDDKPGVSNCNNSCAITWRPYSSGATAQSQFPANITIIKRADGSQQFAWKGKPLYYFVSDTQPGQITGDGLNGFHIAN